MKLIKITYDVLKIIYSFILIFKIMKSLLKLFTLSILIYSCQPQLEPPVEVDCTKCTKSITGYEVVVVESVYDNTQMKQMKAICPEGKKALSAGWSVLDSTSAILSGRATYSEPSFDGKHWMVNAINTNTNFSPKWKLRIRCICADIN